MNEAQSQYPSDIQFAGLVQAATDAAGQEERWSNGSNGQITQAEIYERSSLADSTTPSLSTAQESYRKRKRDDSDDLPQGQYVPVSDPSRPELSYDYRPDDNGSRDGIASALFREPSEKSKRYTRPPMSSLYTSLQLAPEHFLRLQAAAKDYMLDENFPERQACVGQRGAGENSDMVKLKLWSCVQEFLEQQGHGERYWGRHVGTPTEQASRTLFWPEDTQKIVKLCVPLLRRMVTNERQRRYAAEARKSVEKTPQSTPVQIRKQLNTAVQPTAIATRTAAPSVAVADILGEGCAPSLHEIEFWNQEHEQEELELLQKALSIDGEVFAQIVVNIDFHLEVFHGGEIASCSPECQQQSIERLWTWSRLQPPNKTSNAPAKDSDSEKLHMLFEICKADARRRRSKDSSGTSSLHTQPLTPLAATPSRTPSMTAAKPSKRTAKTPTSVVRQPDPGQKGQRNNNITLLVNVISKDSSTSSSSRRVMPRFSLAPESATNLASLRAEIQQRYDAVSPGMAKGEVGSSIKVWLPDGLVQVKDDGEWMVALLSANMVEWMDGEVRIVVEL